MVKYTPIDNETFIYLDQKFQAMEDRQARIDKEHADRQAKIDKEHKEEQNKVNETLFKKLDSITKDVNEVDKKVAYTNGTVRQHTKEIEGLVLEVKHEDCPGKIAMAHIKDKESQDKVKKGRDYKLGKALGLLLLMVGILKGLDYFITTDSTVKKTEETKEIKK